MVDDGTIFRFNTAQCQDDPEAAEDVIMELCEVCSTAWATSALSLRFWDTLDGPWIDDFSEATHSTFLVEIMPDDDDDDD